VKPPEEYRKFLKADIWEDRPGFLTDQEKGLPPPPPQKPYPEDAELIDLVAPEDLTSGAMGLREAINLRRSRRRYAGEALTLEELTFLLWATQGVREVMHGGAAVFRTVPSAGARHAFETYLVIQRVEGLTPGLYRYLSVEHKLCLLRARDGLSQRAADAAYGQSFVAGSAVVFIWTAIPYRMEWRYGAISPKIIALDAGHVCQNLYLACEAAGAGTCAIAAYHQGKMDDLVGVDGTDEFVVYVAPVGKVP
jgi:SagB-type dehydrogenase family enzyme